MIYKNITDIKPNPKNPRVIKDEIDEMGAGMYKGKKVTLLERQQAAEA